MMQKHHDCGVASSQKSSRLVVILTVPVTGVGSDFLTVFPSKIIASQRKLRQVLATEFAAAEAENKRCVGGSKGA